MLESEIQLERLASYPDGWDGAGTLKMSEQTHAWGKQVLSLIDGQHQPELTLNENGTVTFEWDLDSLYIYLEVGATRYALLLRHGEASEHLNGENGELAHIIPGLIVPNLEGKNS